MKISKLLQDRLAKHLKSHSSASGTQECPDFNHADLIESNRQQVLYAQNLIESHTALVDARKTVNASIGKARKAGKDATVLIGESRQLSVGIQKTDNDIDNLLLKIVDQWVEYAEPSQSRGTANEPPTAPTTRSSYTNPALNESYSKRKSPGQFRPLASDSTPLNTAELSISNDINAEDWNTYVSSNLHATHYHQYEWQHLIRRNFRQRTHYLAAVDSKGNIVGVTAAVFMKSLVVDSCLLSTPFLIYGGPVADTPTVSKILAEQLTSVAAQYGCSSTKLRETQPREGWSCSLDKVAMVLTLPSDCETLNRDFGAKLRSQVKRANRESPVLQVGGAELINEFYTVFSRKMRDHGTPVYAKRFFEDVAATFPDSTQLAIVRLNGRTVAASFLIRYRDTVEVPWAASVREFDKLGMNMFMYHGLLEDAVKRGYHFFDFGRSTKGCETWRFKKQWGAIEHQLYWHSRIEDDQSHNLNEDAPGNLMQLAVRTWKRLPVPVANVIGPTLARQLPW